MVSVVASTGRASPYASSLDMSINVYTVFTCKYSRDLYSQIDLFLLRIVHISELDFNLKLDACALDVALVVRFPATVVAFSLP